MKLPIVLAILCVSASAWADDDHPFDGFAAVTAAATSQLNGTHGPGDAFGEYAAGWCAKKGTGVGDSVTFTFATPTDLTDLVIETTPVKKANRVTKLTVALDGAAPVSVALDKHAKADLPIGTKVTTIQIGIAAAKKGKKRTSCLRAWVRGAPNPLLIVSDAKAAAALATDGPKIVAALSACDAKQLADTVAYPLEVTMHTDGEHDEDTTTYASAADLASKHCNVPSFDYPDCSPGELDTVDCEMPGTGGDQLTLWLVWRDQRWKLGGGDITIGTGE